MSKLTDTQRGVLATAAGRDDGAGILPTQLNKVAAAKVGSSLVTRKLMREVRSKPGMPVWRQDGNGRSFSLVILRAGREAISAADKTSAVEAKPIRDEPHHEDAGSLSNAAIPRAGSKQALIVAMLSSEEGATLEALTKATGWLPHTTRAAITGVRKRGLPVERAKEESRGSVYRITSDQKPPKAA